MIRNRGTIPMKLLTTALLAAGLVALGACSGSDDDAANNVGAETLNVAPDDLGNDLLVDETLANDLVVDNTALNAADNAAAGNTAGNSL
jgi:hypothetical protein